MANFQLLAFLGFGFPATVLAAKRLTVEDGRLKRPDGSPIRLTGFTWEAIVHKPADGEGDIMGNILPGANVARILWPWGNSAPYDPKAPAKHVLSHCSTIADCMTSVPPYFNDACFSCMDNAIKQATSGKREVWVVLATRGEFIAGQCSTTPPGYGCNNTRQDGHVFGNPQLAQRFYTALAHVANHYKTWDYIGAYEPLSEPRVKDAQASVVTSFYAGACSSVQKADVGTPCLVGPRPYYNLNAFDDSIIIPDNRNVIYSFDYFNPPDYIFGSTKVSKYPGQYRCEDLNKGWVSKVTCPQGAQQLISFDANWHRDNLQRASSLRGTHGVPIFINQWEIRYGITEANGHYQYVQDIASVAMDLDIGWAWWTWRGSAGGFKPGSSDIISGSEVDQKTVDTMRPFMSNVTWKPDHEQPVIV